MSDCEMQGNVCCRYYVITVPPMIEPVCRVVVFALLEVYSPGTAHVGDLLGLYVLCVWNVKEALSAPLCR